MRRGRFSNRGTITKRRSPGVCTYLHMLHPKARTHMNITYARRRYQANIVMPLARPVNRPIHLTFCRGAWPPLVTSSRWDIWIWAHAFLTPRRWVMASRVCTWALVWAKHGSGRASQYLCAFVSQFRIHSIFIPARASSDSVSLTSLTSVIDWHDLSCNYSSMHSLGNTMFWWLMCGQASAGRIIGAAHEMTLSMR